MKGGREKVGGGSDEDLTLEKQRSLGLRGAVERGKQAR